MKKVHIGSGQHYRPGYINIEYTPDLPFKKDMVSSGMELPFKENTVDEIISFHVIEHMPRPQKNNDEKWRKNVDDFLYECFRTLKIGGTFIAECPDFEKIVSEIVNEANWDMIDHVFGLDRYKGDTHQWGYTKKSLKNLLKKHGFDNIKISDGTDYHILNEPSLRVEAQKIGLKRINIEPTSACNLECTICTRDEVKRPNKNMDFSTYRSLIDQLFNLGLLDVEIRYFLSGEPLVAGKALNKMIKYAKKIGFTNTLIHTNGTLLNKYGEGILKAGIDTVSISFDGADRETYESIRLNSEFEKTANRVKTFLQWAKEYPTKTIVQTIVSENVDKNEYKEKMIALLPDADEYHVRYPHNWNTLDTITGQTKFTEKVKKCFPSENMSIYADGTMPVCCADLNGDYIIADATKEPLIDIWINQLGDIRDRMAEGLPIPELCDNCERYADNKKSYSESLEDIEELISNGKLDSAEGIISNQLLKNPNSTDLQLNLGVIKTIQEKYSDALSIFKKILIVDPSNEIVIENIKFMNQQLEYKNQLIVK